jgi:hypothetical protein
LDPEAIGIGTWSEIGRMLTNLWFVVLFVVFFAANLLVAHNVVPSFVASGHIPVSVKKAGVAFYVLAIISLGLALFFRPGRWLRQRHVASVLGQLLDMRSRSPGRTRAGRRLSSCIEI